MQRSIRHVMALITLGLVSSVSLTTSAQDCILTEAVNTYQGRFFKLANLQPLNDFLDDQFYDSEDIADVRSLIISATSEWNENSHGLYLIYNGEVNALAGGVVDGFKIDQHHVLPAEDCTAQQNFSVIRIWNGYHDDGSNNLVGRHYRRCDNTQFEVVIFRRRFDGDASYPRSFGDKALVVGSGVRDLQGVVAHEVGHHVLGSTDNTSISTHLGLDTAGNPLPGSAYGPSVMNQGTIANVQLRALFEADIRCSGSPSTANPGRMYRNTEGAYRYMFPSAGLSMGSIFTPLGDLAKFAISHVSAGTWNSLYHSYSANDTMRGTGMGSTSGVALPTSPLDSIGQRQLRLREFPGHDLVLYSQHTNSVPTGAVQDEAVHRLRYIRSNNGFSTTTSGDLLYCLNASCSSVSLIYTNDPVGTAWAPQAGKTVFAWVNHRRESSDNVASPLTDGMVYVSVGFNNTGSTPGNTLAHGQLIGARSDVSPGLACRAKPGVPGTDECLVAYTDYTDARSVIKIFRFEIVNGVLMAGTDLFRFPSFGTSSYETSSPVALWYDGAAFHLAWRSHLPTQPILALHSASGSSGTWSGLAVVSGAYPDTTHPPVTGPVVDSAGTDSGRYLSWTRR